ncbi:MAG: MBL fold metallo-hydrolase [Vallitaleaceae bacterium]|nr:MBL fold metallo-hydrolase [Vallitaleaceae bacterium]
MDNKIMTIGLGYVKAFLIKGDKYILIDTGIPKSFETIKRYMTEHGINPGDISLVIITHNHLDHTGSISKIKELTSAPVLIHKSEDQYLSKGITTPVQTRSLLPKLLMKLMKTPEIKPFSADIIMKNNDAIDLKPYGVTGKIMYTPGHTEGSISVLLDNGHAVVGDLFSAKKTLKGIKASFPFIYNDLNTIRDSMRKLLNQGCKQFYNAHGVVCDEKALKTLLDKENIK